MRISDWSSDVCSSDLLPYPGSRGRSNPHEVDFSLRFLSAQASNTTPKSLTDRLPDRLVVMARCRRHTIDRRSDGLDDFARDVLFRLHVVDAADRTRTRLNFSH